MHGNSFVSKSVFMTKFLKIRSCCKCNHFERVSEGICLSSYERNLRCMFAMASQRMLWFTPICCCCFLFVLMLYLPINNLSLGEFLAFNHTKHTYYIHNIRPCGFRPEDFFHVFPIEANVKHVTTGAGQSLAPGA